MNEGARPSEVNPCTLPEPAREAIAKAYRGYGDWGHAFDVARGRGWSFENAGRIASLAFPPADAPEATVTG